MMHSMMRGLVPPTGRVETERNRSVGMIVVAAFATLIVLLVLAAISPQAMFIGAGVTFATLLVRFIWLVRRELK